MDCAHVRREYIYIYMNGLTETNGVTVLRFVVVFVASLSRLSLCLTLAHPKIWSFLRRKFAGNPRPQLLTAVFSSLKKTRLGFSWLRRRRSWIWLRKPSSPEKVSRLPPMLLPPSASPSSLVESPEECPFHFSIASFSFQF